MSSRKEFEVWAEGNGHDTYRSGGDGGYYFQSTQWSWDIWQAATKSMEAKCAALTAENAQLYTFIKDDCWVWDDKAEEYLDAADCIATAKGIDSSLDEVRAQGVEMVIAYHRERAEALHHVDRNNAIRHSMAALDASDVAAQLRQEAAQ